MKATARQVEAYRKRLARISTADGLTAECLNAVIDWNEVTDRPDPKVREDRATLVGYRVYTEPGLFGLALMVEVTVCRGCVGTPATDCKDEGPYTLYGAQDVRLHRNEPDLPARADL